MTEAHRWEDVCDGVYQAAFLLSRMPAEKITAIVGQVSPGVFSAAQTDHAQLRRYTLLLTEGLSLLTFAPLVGLGLVASEAIPVILGNEWLGAVLPLQILSVGAALTGVTPVLPQVLQVVGETRLSMRLTLVAAVIFVTAFVVRVRWGTAGGAVAWLLVHPTSVVLPTLFRVRRRISLTFSAYANALWPAASATLVMAAVVVSARIVLSTHLSTARLLAVEAGMGALAYGATLVTLHRSRTRRLFGAARLLRS